jgi:hypothetical protein
MQNKDLYSNEKSKSLYGKIETIMQKYDDAGYEFHNQITIPTTINPGYLGSFMGGKTSYIDVSVLIFRKLVD